LPGDSLYRVKRAQETLRLQLVRDEQTRQNLQLSFKERREDEVRELLRLGRKGSVTFEGVVEAQDVEGWMVSSLPVGLNTETEIVGQIKPGDSVIVVGTTRPQGDILASKIQLHTYQLIGTVDQQSPGLWTVAGQPLVLLPSSQVQTGIVPGDRVLVLVEVTATGGHEALVILSLATEAVPVGASTPIPPVGPPSTPAPSVDDGNEVTVEFSGFVEGRDGLTWTVAGQTLLQTSQSEIRGNLVVGDRVRVRALTRTDGGLILLRIERTDSQSGNDDKATPDAEPTDGDGENEGSSTPEPPDDEPEEIRFSGEISSVSAGQWVIDGQTLRITGDTEIDADLKVGDRADVRARRFPDGHLEADRIEEAD
ncbi:MAG: DUF5666 domain-containing protein, partial [Anaerolineales bacterium]|nr:DUF5666 domain-containing protein [Anaerolineales bacterium]